MILQCKNEDKITLDGSAYIRCSNCMFISNNII